jgi:hypothetical protein
MIRVAATAAVLAACGGCAVSVADPACPVHVYDKFVGTVLHHPTVTSTFWGDGWAGSMSATYTDAVTRLSKSDAASRVAEYGVEGFTADPTAYEVTVPVSSLVEDATLRNDLLGAINDGRLPAPAAEQVYVVYLPRATTTRYMVSNNAAGYHMWAETNDGHQFAYAVVTWQPTFEDTMRNVTHELWEAFTDPDTTTGFRADAVGPEVADLCEDRPSVVLEGDVAVTQSWSQVSCGCR